MHQYDRKTTRMNHYSYSTPGNYFITICTLERLPFLGMMKDKGIELSSIGCLVETAIQQMNSHYQNTNVDSYTIMPNHIHFILSILGAGCYLSPTDSFESRREASETAGSSEPTLVTIPDIIRNFKSYTANRFYAERKGKLWHRGYYEHIIRSENEFRNIQQYIKENPQRWLTDKFYLAAGATASTWGGPSVGAGL